jgi:hypothetical protein
MTHVEGHVRRDRPRRLDADLGLAQDQLTAIQLALNYRPQLTVTARVDASFRTAPRAETGRMTALLRESRAAVLT